MSGPRRIDEGGSAIRRDTRLAFRFDGRAFSGHAGDTIASALLANGVRIVARSFKYHRPRGVVAAGCEEPNAVVDLRTGARHDPNARATLEPLVDGMVIGSVHARGTAARDRLAVIDRLHRWIPAAFYYKTFKWPGWSAYEPTIRAMAGLGRLDGRSRASAASARHVDVDVCVIGAGAAGLEAASRAIRSGHRVLVIEQRPSIGGALGWRDGAVEGATGADWIAARHAELQAGGATVLTRTTALATYDHGSVVAVERGVDAGVSPNGERAWIVRARRLLLAAGALQRPLVFEDNDRPGVMLADAALEYLRVYGVRVGSRAVVATIDDSAYGVAAALAAAGAHCEIVDARPAGAAAERARAAGLVVHERRFLATSCPNGARPRWRAIWSAVACCATGCSPPAAARASRSRPTRPSRDAPRTGGSKSWSVPSGGKRSGVSPSRGLTRGSSLATPATSEAPRQSVKPAAPPRHLSRRLAAAKLRVTLAVRDANN